MKLLQLKKEMTLIDCVNNRQAAIQEARRNGNEKKVEALEAMNRNDLERYYKACRIIEQCKDPVVKNDLTLLCIRRYNYQQAAIKANTTYSSMANRVHRYLKTL